MEEVPCIKKSVFLQAPPDELQESVEPSGPKIQKQVRKMSLGESGAGVPKSLEKVAKQSEKSQYLSLQSNLKHGWFTRKFANHIWTPRFVWTFLAFPFKTRARGRKFMRTGGFRCGPRTFAWTCHVSDWIVGRGTESLEKSLEKVPSRLFQDFSRLVRCCFPHLPVVNKFLRFWPSQTDWNWLKLIRIDWSWLKLIENDRK